MLAEAWQPELLKSNLFDMYYGWETHHIMNRIAKGENTVSDWDKNIFENTKKYEANDIAMNFVDNHDENSWNGTMKSRLGAAEETMTALDLIVRQGKALYVGLSNYKSEDATKAFAILKELGTPCLIHQPKYSMFERWVEKDGLLNVLEANGVGCIPFSPLAQGLLTNKYLKGIPEGSRATKGVFLKQEQITEEVLAKVRALNDIATTRNQSLAQMALAWLLKDERVTSVLIGASSSAQLLDSVDCLKNLKFTVDELTQIETVLG